MKDLSDKRVSEPEVLSMEPRLLELIPSIPGSPLMSPTVEGIIASSYLEIPDQDDRYPGSFFRIPGPPIPGKTTWSIN